MMGFSASKALRPFLARTRLPLDPNALKFLGSFSSPSWLEITVVEFEKIIRSCGVFA
jgi:hypothetical protein